MLCKKVSVAPALCPQLLVEWLLSESKPFIQRFWTWTTDLSECRVAVLIRNFVYNLLSERPTMVFWFGRRMSLNDDEKRRWKVWPSLSTPLLSLQVGTATKCVPGPTWMGMGWGKELISSFLGIRIQLATSTQLVGGVWFVNTRSDAYSPFFTSRQPILFWRLRDGLAW